MFKFFDPDFECFAKYDAFCSHVFDVRAEGVRFIPMEEVRNYGKIVYITNIVEMAGRRMLPPHPVVGFKFFVSRFYYRSYILSASSVSTNGTSISSNANRFAVMINFPKTVL